MYYYEVENEPSSTVNYIGLSTFLHILLGFAALFVSLNVVKPEVPPTIIEIEVLPPKGVQTQSLSAPSAAPVAPVEALPVAKMVSAPAIKAKSLAVKRSAPKAQSNYVPKFSIAKSEVVSFPDDEPAPEIPSGDSGSEFQSVAESLSDSAFNEGIANSNDEDFSEGEKLIGAIGSDIDSTRDAEINSIDQKIGSLKQSAGERKAAIQRQGAFNRAMIASKYAEGANGPGGNGHAQKKFGVPTGVRKLEDLRQRPGNPKPTYAIDDRVNRRQGEVIYVAYINKQGVPSDFRKLKGTGYVSLDQRALQTLKKWKFYPGQEGWVEIPFNWNLKSGAVTASRN